MNEVFNRMKGEFFSIMAPGFHLLVAALIAFLASSEEIPPSLELDSIRSIEFNKYWPLYILATFLAYLLGNFLRAIPIGGADTICSSLFRWMHRRPRGNAEANNKNNDNDKKTVEVQNKDENKNSEERSSLVAIYYWTKFPYQRALARLLRDLQNSGVAGVGFVLPQRKRIHTAFNYFKSVLCADVPGAFEYTQALESRVRLFAGMFWSSCAGIAVCAGLGMATLSPDSGVSWTSLYTALLAVSIAGILLGSQLPRVRGQEVEYVFYAYLAYHARKSASQGKPSQPD